MNRNIDIQPSLGRLSESGDFDRLAVETSPLWSASPSSDGHSPRKDVGSLTKQLDSNQLDTEEKKLRRKKKWKKPKDKPSRPLSAYNLFFQSERSLMLGADAPSKELERLKKRVHCRTHGKIGFAAMARSIGAQWKSLNPEKRKVFEDQAFKEKQRYAKELADWKAQQKERVSRDESKGGLHAIATVAIASGPVKTREMNDETIAKVFTEASISILLEQRQQNIDYLRALQDHSFGLSQFGTSLLNYPSAAEASASALLQQFQGTSRAVLPRRAFHLYDVDRVSQLGLPYYSPSHGSSVRQAPYMSHGPV